MSRITCSVVAAISLLALPVRATAPLSQKQADIDPNALADALMGVLGGADISDTTDLFDDSEADAEELRNRMFADMERRLEEDRNKKVQNEDVIPIAGDSSAPVDEIMDDDAPAFQLVSLLARKPSQPDTLRRPFVTFTGFRDGVSQMRIFSPHGLSAAARSRLTSVHVVMTPLSAAGQKRLEAWLGQVAPHGSGVHVTSLPVRGYCLEAANVPPSFDQVFVGASHAVQEQFKPAKAVRITAEFAASHGYLRPQGDPAAYGRFVAQYAMWTASEHWDQARFTNEFLSRTKQDMTAAKKPWTDETDQTLRALAPARWRDVQLVIDASHRVEQRVRTSGASEGGMQ